MFTYWDAMGAVCILPIGKQLPLLFVEAKLPGDILGARPEPYGANILFVVVRGAMICDPL